VNWIEISVRCDGEGAEAVGELFNRYNSGPQGRGGAIVDIGGFDSVGELTEPVITVRTYLLADDEGCELSRRIQEGLYHLGRIYPLPEPEVQEIAETDWAEAWKAHYRPLRVGRRLLITPTWLAAEAEPGPGDVVIELDPGMAFGSGLHPSTRLCLVLLEKHLRAGDRVLDLGSGSGILAIAAAKMGAAGILARDTDPVAVQVAQENVTANGVAGRVRVELGSLPHYEGSGQAGQGAAEGAGDSASTVGAAAGAADSQQTWDLILVNILAGVIVALLEQGLSRLLAPGGRLILAGIILQRAGDVEAALQANGLAVSERLQEGDWLALLVQRSTDP